MEHYAPKEPRQNLFNIFDKGKDFFIIRTVVTLLAIIALVIGCLKLAQQAWEVYPVVIRDPFGNVSMGVGSTYRESPQEIVRMVTTVAEAMFTQTEEGVAEQVLAPFLSRDIMRNLTSQRTPRQGYVSTAFTSDFFFGDIDRQRGLRVVFLQLELVAASGTNIMVDNAYLNFVIRRGPRSVANPSGWYIAAMQPISRANFFESRRRFVNDPISAADHGAQLMNLPDW